MGLELDHFMWVVPDLASGMDEIERLTGVRPIPGGAHEGLGTRNALLGLGDSVYLEILAPDPEQDMAGTMGAQLAHLGQSGLVAWAVRTENLARVVDGLSASFPDWQARKPLDVSRKRPDGQLIEWQLLLPGLSHRGVPFFIDWLTSPHPTQDLPEECSVESFVVRSADSESLEHLGLGQLRSVTIVPGAEVTLELELQTPAGKTVLTSLDPLPDDIRI